VLVETIPIGGAAAAQAPNAQSRDRSSQEEREPPPSPVGQDERRMQVRAYDLWNRLLGTGQLPAIADLKPADHPALSSFGALLDFTGGRADPRIAYLGERLAAECGVSGQEVASVSHLPERSLLARIADHYVKAMVSAEPIGFEAEFVNQRDKTILYRGILLPFSRHGRAIDYVFGVINWKEAAERALVEELLLELGQALQDGFDEPAAPAGGDALPQRRALPAIDAQELQAIDAAGGEFALVAVARTQAGRPIVLGEVRRGTDLFDKAAGRAAG